MAIGEGSPVGARPRRGDGVRFDLRTISALFASCMLCFVVGAIGGYYYQTGSAGTGVTWHLSQVSADASTQGQGNLVEGRAGKLRPLGPGSQEAGQGLPQKPTRVCTNTCPRARDGVCDDGRRPDTVDTVRPVLCDLGTDCDDCGAYEGLPVETWPGTNLGPMHHLTLQNTSVFVRTTNTQPPFKILVTDPKLDLDVSSHIHNFGSIEAGITQIFHMVLKERCIKPDGSRELVVDVGANFGYFAVYAAMMGCRVVAWEPVPAFYAFTRTALKLNAVEHLVDLRRGVVAEKAGEEVEIRVPKRGVWGTASVASVQPVFDHVPDIVRARTERLDAVVDEDVLLIKVDVEGYEPLVMASADKLLQARQVENIVLEYNAGVAERLAAPNTLNWQLLDMNPKMLLKLLNLGFKIGMMNDNIAKSAPVNYAYPMPPLPEVVLENIKYDIYDITEWKRQQQPCITELIKLNPYWGVCNIFPEDVHPKSLRSMFPFNTNLWISKSPQLKLSKPVGVFAPDQNITTEWSSRENPDFGLGLRSCMHVPPDHLVRNRCSCKYARTRNLPADQVQACDAEEAMVMKLLKEGRMLAKDPPADFVATA